MLTLLGRNTYPCVQPTMTIKTQSRVALTLRNRQSSDTGALMLPAGSCGQAFPKVDAF